MEDTSKDPVDVAKQLVKDNRPARACIILRDWLKDNVATADVHALFAQALANRGRHAEAVKYLRRALDDGDDVSLRLALARSEAASGETDKAMSDLEAAKRLSPASPEVHEAIAGALRSTDRLPEALNAANQAVSLAPKRFEAHLARVEVRIALNQRREAAAALVEALLLDPRRKEGWSHFGDLSPELRPEEIRRLHRAVLRGAPPGGLDTWAVYLTAHAPRAAVATAIRAVERLTSLARTLSSTILVTAMKAAGGERVVERIQRKLDGSPPVNRLLFAYALGAGGLANEPLGTIRSMLAHDSAGSAPYELLDVLPPQRSIPIIESLLDGSLAERAVARLVSILVKFDEQAIEPIAMALAKHPRFGQSATGHLYRAWVLAKKSDRTAAANELNAALTCGAPLQHDDWDRLVDLRSQLAVDLSQGLQTYADKSRDSTAIRSVIDAAVRMDYPEVALRMWDQPSIQDAPFPAFALRSMVEKTAEQLSISDPDGPDGKPDPKRSARRSLLEHIRGAASKLESAIDSEGDAELAVAYAENELGNWRNAIAAFESAARVAPENDSIYAAWATALEKWDRDEGVVGLLVERLTGDHFPRSKHEAFLRIADELAGRAADHTRMLDRLCSALEDWTDWNYPLITPMRVLEAPGLAEHGLRLARLQINRASADSSARQALAMACLRVGRFTEALAVAQSLDGNAADTFATLATLGDAFNGLERYDEASAAYEKAVTFARDASSPIDPDQLVMVFDKWAAALAEKHRYAQAVAVARQALTEDVRQSDIYFRLGYTLTDMGLPLEAEKQYEKAVSLDRTSPHSPHNLAFLRYRRGQCRYAYETFKEVGALYEAKLADAIRRRDDHYCRSMAVAQLALDRHQEAEALLRVALAIAPGTPETLMALVSIYAEAKKLTAEKLAQAKAQRSREAESLASQLAEQHWRMRECAQQAEQALDIRARTDDIGGDLIGRAEVLFAVEDLSAAEAAFTKALERNRESVRAQRQLGELFLRTGRPEQAIASFVAALRIDADDLDVRCNLGRAFLRASKLDEAEAEYRRVLATAPGWTPALLGLGEVVLARADKPVGGTELRSSVREGYYVQAIDLFTEGLRFADPKICPKGFGADDRASLHYLRGFAHVQLAELGTLTKQRGRIAMARKDFELSGKLDPESPRGNRALERLEETARGTGSGGLLERAGGGIVIALALFIFATAQVSFWHGRLFDKEGVTIAQEALPAFASYPSLKVVEAAVHSAVDSHTIYGDEAEVAKLADTYAKGDDAARAKEILLRSVRKATRPATDRLTATEYGMLSFSAIILLIGGAFLPFLTGLKFAGLQIDKTSSTNRDTIRNFGISR